jgi:ATP-dependent exoDNAse (exonuclease V) beta subunit
MGAVRMIPVTRLIALLDKPALLKWANRIGLQGIDLERYQSESKSKGNTAHNEVERYFKHGELFSGVEKLQASLIGFKVIGCEVNINNGFICGRIDLVLHKNNELYICDFKSSKCIYLSTKLQLATYKHLYKGHKICYINLDTYELVEIKIQTAPYFEVVKRLYQIHELLTNLNERL